MFRIFTSARAYKVFTQSAATFAHPSDASCGYACHECIVGHVVGYHGSGGYHGRASDGVSTHYCGVGSDGGSFSDKSGCVDPVHGEVSPWSGDIGEDTRGATEDIVFECHTLVYAHIVLYANTIADMHAATDIDILPKRAVFAYASSALYVAEMPYLGSIANGYIVVDVGRWMDEVFIVCVHS